MSRATLAGLAVAVFASTFSASLTAGDTPGVSTPAGAVQVLRITPDGETNSSERQIVVQFDRPMIVLGSAPPVLKDVPVDVTPEVSCNWHWVNTSTLACELGEKGGAASLHGRRFGFQPEQGGFSPATHYHVKVHAGFKAVDGNTLTSDASGDFFTERPAATYGHISDWSGPTLPVVQLNFTLPVTKSSVEAHLYFSSSAGRTAVSAASSPDDERDYYVIPTGGGEPVHVPGKSSSAGEGGDEGEGGSAAPAAATAAVPAVAPPAGEEARYSWLLTVRPKAKPLPGAAAVSLSADSGLASPLGPDKSLPQSDIVQFTTFGEFIFEGVNCGDNEDHYLDQPGNAASAPECDPQHYVGMVFSAPMTKDELEKHVQGKVDNKSIDPIGYLPEDYSWRHSEGREHGQSVFVTFPIPLKANADYAVQFSAGMQDVWGRPMKKAGASHFHTTHRHPSLELEEETAVLEKGVDSEVPLYFTNLDALTAQYQAYLPYEAPAAVAEQKTFEYKLPGVQDLSVGLPLNVRGMLGGKDGAVWGSLQPQPEFERQPIKFFAEVTPYAVSVKVGHYNTLVWVTDMSTGLPVSGARVDIFKSLENAPPRVPADAPRAFTDASGVAMLPGGVTLDPDLEARSDIWQQDKPRLMVKVTHGMDMALLPLGQLFRVDTGQASHEKVWEQLRKQYGHVHAWGTTAEGIYRAGDTIQYKLYVRDQDNRGFVPPPSMPYTLELIDPMGNSVYKVPDLKLSEFGSYDGQYAIPANASVGWYTFKLSASGLPETLEPIRVLVSDFTPAPFHVDSSLNGASFQPGDKVEVTTTARLHSGGPYTDAEGRVTVTVKAEDFRSKDPAVEDFSFAAYDAQDNQNEQQINQTSDKLDNNGVLKAGFDLQDAGIYFGKLLVEGAVRDERGKYIASVTRADYLGRDRFVGLRLNSWVLHAKEPASVDYVVVDAGGKPIAGSKVTIAIERMDSKAARVKGPGNAYLTQYTREWVSSGSCEAESTAAAASCTFTPDQPGEFRIKASVTDTHGRVHTSSLPAWAAGQGEVVWEDKDDGALTIVPEKSEYHVGDTARYLVQNPFPGAQALISIERYGVLKSWVQTLDGSTPIISFPVEQDYVPGYFLSITVISPRVAKPLPGAGEVDLGKPTFRSGYVEVPVVDDYKALDVKVTAAKDSYKPRDKVDVSVEVKARHGDAGKMELAVAVLDDSVFDLLAEGKAYFDPYKGFYSVDGLDVMNFDLLTRLVGRQAFEKKGATPGGDGGAAISLRSLFKFVSYWNPSLHTDAGGKAKFNFTVPDNLTGWRVLVLAVNSGDRMGLGDATFKVNRPTELRPVIPNQIVQGDKFSAGFSVMNRTDKARDLKVHVTVKGSVDGAPVLDTVVHVDPYKRVQVSLPVQSTGPGSLDFIATAGDELDGDGMTQSVPVERRVNLVTLAQYGTTTEAHTEPVQYPADAVDGSAVLGVGLAPSVIGNVQGAFSYLRDYPYLCWEQRLTKAVMAANYKRLKPYVGDSVSWTGSGDIPAQALSDAAAFQAPNGGMVYWLADDRYTDPYLSAYTALGFNWLRAQGYAVPSAVEQKLHAYLQNFLRNDSGPDFYDLGMRSSVRAVILAALAADHEVALSDLQRYAPHLREMSLFGQAWFMQAALDLGSQDQAAADLKLILNHANETGGKFEFSETLDDGYLRILSTPMRSNCAILSALSRYAASSQANAGVIADVPFKLVRSITQIRGGREHWENTQENLFCMQALADYAQAYEQTAPKMQVAVTAGPDSLGSASFQSVRDAAVLLTHPLSGTVVGANLPVTITPTGQGRLYYNLRLTYAPATQAQEVNDGIEIHREYSVQRDGKWLLLKSPMSIDRGELVRVDLYVSVPAAREFVVVDDPVPGGLEPVDRNLATSSGVDVKAGSFQAAGGAFWFNFDDWEDYGVQFWDFYHQELRHDSARFYADYLPAGHYHLSYSAQAIAPGSFAVQPSKVEEMYDPDVFGLTPSGVLQVNDSSPAKP